MLLYHLFQKVWYFLSASYSKRYPTLCNYLYQLDYFIYDYCYDDLCLQFLGLKLVQEQFRPFHYFKNYGSSYWWIDSNDSPHQNLSQTLYIYSFPYHLVDGLGLWLYAHVFPRILWCPRRTMLSSVSIPSHFCSLQLFTRVTCPLWSHAS